MRLRTWTRKIAALMSSSEKYINIALMCWFACYLFSFLFSYFLCLFLPSFLVGSRGRGLFHFKNKRRKGDKQEPTSRFTVTFHLKQTIRSLNLFKSELFFYLIFAVSKKMYVLMRFQRLFCLLDDLAHNAVSLVMN